VCDNGRLADFLYVREMDLEVETDPGQVGGNRLWEDVLGHENDVKTEGVRSWIQWKVVEGTESIV